MTSYCALSPSSDMDYTVVLGFQIDPETGKRVPIPESLPVRCPECWKGDSALLEPLIRKRRLFIRKPPDLFGTFDNWDVFSAPLQRVIDELVPGRVRWIDILVNDDPAFVGIPVTILELNDSPEMARRIGRCGTCGRDREVLYGSRPLPMKDMPELFAVPYESTIGPDLLWFVDSRIRDAIRDRGKFRGIDWGPKMKA